MAECLSEEQLENLVAGTVSETQADGLYAHLEQCLSCRQLLKESRANRVFLAKAKAALADSHIPADAEAVDRRLPEDHPGERKPPVPPYSIPGYEILREIHRGGQGVVYEAVQPGTKRKVALKVMIEGPFASESSKRRFQREVELIASLRHPNIVTLHESGVAEGKYYFAMDYVRGRPLDRHTRSENLSVSEIVRLFVRICEAVSFAHRRGVMHRDLKPSNILVGDCVASDEGTPYVLDFGLAKITQGPTDDADRQTRVSASGHIVGTLRYMSPEQTIGDAKAIDIRTDVYSLGVILYELLTGSPPYDTQTEITAAIRNIREAIPRRPSKVNKRVNSEIDAILFQAMEKDPERRYQSAGELGRDLHAWLDGDPVSAKSASSLYVIRKLAVRHRYATAVLATLLLTICSSAAIVFDFWRREQAAAAELQRTNQAVLQRNKGLERMAANVQARATRHVLGWFLLEWGENRFDRARQIRDHVSAASPEHEAMGFLLDEAYTEQKLRTALGPDAEPLVQFIIGQRALKAGRHDEAVKAFERCRALSTDGWLIESAKARLRQLRPETARADSEETN